MTAPIPRDRQIELMKTANERQNALVDRLIANPTVKKVAVTRSLKLTAKVQSSYQTTTKRKLG